MGQNSLSCYISEVVFVQQHEKTFLFQKRLPLPRLICQLELPVCFCHEAEHNEHNAHKNGNVYGGLTGCMQ